MESMTSVKNRTGEMILSLPLFTRGVGGPSWQLCQKGRGKRQGTKLKSPGGRCPVVEQGGERVKNESGGVRDRQINGAGRVARRGDRGHFFSEMTATKSCSGH